MPLNHKRSLTEEFFGLAIILIDGHNTGFEYGNSGYVQRHNTEISAECGHIHLFDTDALVVDLKM